MKPINYKVFKFFLFFLLPSLPVFSNDSLRTLSWTQVLDLVRMYHPVVKQADINIGIASAEIKIARGMFDPVVGTKISNKTFDGNEYYNHKHAEIKIPTWYGIELYAGIENLSGNRTDPVQTIGRTTAAGITLPIAKNLLIDKRRAMLQTAKIFSELSQTEKKIVINNILREAGIVYWEWVKYYLYYKIYSDALTVNEKRFELVKTAFRQGDRPAMDTTEALTQLQLLQIYQSQSRMEFINKGLDLSTFLWTLNNTPYDIPADVTPSQEDQRLNTHSLPVASLDTLLTATRESHPELIQYDFLLSVLNIEKKLKFQELLPEINFRYNQLGRGYNVVKNTFSPLLENNYQYGIGIAIPIRFSKGRGEYKRAKLKISETEIKRNLKLLQLENKVREYYNVVLSLFNQIAISERAVINYDRLLQAEKLRFSNGESSLFLVNTREFKKLEADQKLTELRINYFQSHIHLIAAAGQLQ